jgi:hypothetical protein
MSPSRENLSLRAWQGRLHSSLEGESSDLDANVALLTAFMFMQIHAGGSALVSDLQSGAQALLKWMRRNLDGGL